MQVSPIEPTVGRSVHYHPAPSHPDHGQVLVALIAKVNPDDTVNLAIFDSCGHHFSRQRVEYADVQGDDSTGHWSWMPYQKGQAAKTEAVSRDTDHALMRHVAMERAAHACEAASVANVGQLVNYYSCWASPPVPCKVIAKSDDLIVDVRPLHEKALFFSDVPAVDFQRDAPTRGHFCTLCEPVAVQPVSAPLPGGLAMAADVPVLNDAVEARP